MTTLKSITTAVAILGSTLLFVSFSGEANSKSKSCRSMGLSNAECACKFALDSGSRSAMQVFLKTYPRSDTACNAQNSSLRQPLVLLNPNPDEGDLGQGPSNKDSSMFRVPSNPNR